jgi:hypothetical protein
MGTHRYACDVLSELREVVKTLRFDRVIGLVEELQTMFNRMEAKLYSYKDIGYDLDRASELAIMITDLEKTAKEIEAKLKREEVIL